MDFKDKLREKLNTPIEAKEERKTDPKLMQLANDYYRKRVAVEVSNIKRTITKEIDSYRLSGQQPDKRTFKGTHTLKTISRSPREVIKPTRIEIIDEGEHIPDEYKYLYYHKNEFFMIRTNDWGGCFISLKPLYYSLRMPRRMFNSFNDIIFDFTDLGKRFYDDVIKECEKEGIITRLYVKSYRTEVNLGQSVSERGDISICLDYLIEL